MTGYRDDYSKSENAYNAEMYGKYPASRLAKKIGVNTGAIKELMVPSEWHHTSKHYNVTDYYDEADALAMLDQLTAWVKPNKSIDKLSKCSGSYLVWGGTRNQPHAQEIKFSDIDVTHKGEWYTLHLPEGNIRKGEQTRGFVLYDKEGKNIVFN